MRQTQMTWLTAGLFALVFSAGPALAQKKDDKAVPAADPKQLLINGIVGATNEAMKGAPGTTVYTADPVAQHGRGRPVDDGGDDVDAGLPEGVRQQDLRAVHGDRAA